MHRTNFHIRVRRLKPAATLKGSRPNQNHFFMYTRSSPMNRLRFVILSLLTVAAAGLFTALCAPQLFSQPAPRIDVASLLPKAPDQEYAMKDGKIVTGGTVANVNGV